MDVLVIPSLLCLFAAMIFLARVEMAFMTIEMDDLEDLRDAETEYQYFREAYFKAREDNASAARHRARGILLLLVALACFVSAVAMLPFHLRDTNVHGRTGAGVPVEERQLGGR